MRCCEAWKPVGKCFDPISLECIDFQRQSSIIANLTRENLAEREAEITNLPWTQTEKDNALGRCRIGQRAWHVKKPMLCLNAVTDEEAATPCKVQNLGHGEAYGENKPNIRISRNVCIVEPLDSTRKRLERTLPEDHEDRIAGKVSFRRVIAILWKSSFLCADKK